MKPEPQQIQAVFRVQLRSAMEDKGLTQERLATEAGVSPASISRWLARHRSPMVPELLSLSRVLGVSMEWLLTGADDTSHSRPTAAPPPLAPLIPCPFCLRADRLQRLRTVTERANGTRLETADVECLRCDVSAPEKAWQGRHFDAATAAALEQAAAHLRK